MSREGKITQSHATITFEGRYGPENVAEVCRCINNYLIAKPDRVLLDFGPCAEAFPNSMLPLVAICSRLRGLGYDFYAFLPKAPEAKRRFIDTNWAHYLSPNAYKMADDFSEPHLAVKHYQTNEEHYVILQRILDLVMRTVKVPRSALMSLDWSLSEIMDNVLVHSESPVGGFVQLAIFPTAKKLAFTVADAGRGILESLREGIPALRSDRVAIEEAVRGGVTRNKDIGQGNGLRDCPIRGWDCV
jgi:anti-sigma regulatory factor (Ser/Thr protein kinase)